MCLRQSASGSRNAARHRHHRSAPLNESRYASLPNIMKARKQVGQTGKIVAPRLWQAALTERRS